MRSANRVVTLIAAAFLTRRRPGSSQKTSAIPHEKSTSSANKRARDTSPVPKCTVLATLSGLPKLAAPAMEVLAGLPRAGEFVIPGGSQGRRANLRGPWRRISSHAELNGFRVHDLRHSFASVGASAGLGLQIIGRLLGHAQPSTTARYSHLADDPLRRASHVISSAIANALEGNVGAEAILLRAHQNPMSRRKSAFPEAL